MSLRVIWQYMYRSIYCPMTLSAMNYLLYTIISSVIRALPSEITPIRRMYLSITSNYSRHDITEILLKVALSTIPYI